MKVSSAYEWIKIAVPLSAVVLLLLHGCGTKNTGSTATSPVVAISITPGTPSIAPNTTLQLAASGKRADGLSGALTALVTWGSSNPSIASVDSKGLATALSAGSTTISAQSGSLAGTVTLTVSPVGALAVTPSSQTIAVGTTFQFTATATLLNGATQDLTTFVTWASSDTSVATTARGLATASSTTTGATTLSASWSGITGTASLSVSLVSSIAVSPASASIILGTSQQFTAMGVLSTGGSTQDLTSWAAWTSTSPAVASVSSTAGSKGLAISASAGTTFISATYAGVVSNAAILTVTAAVINSIAVTPVSASVAVGGTQQFVAMGTYSDGTQKDISAAATWTSNAPAVATISNAAGSNGLATAKAAGTTSISASFSGKTSNSAAMTVIPAVLMSMTLSPANPSMVMGTVVQFTAIGTLSDGTTTDLTSSATWTSSNQQVATVSDQVGSKGLATSAAVTGTSTITATSGPVSGSTVLTVTLF